MLTTHPAPPSALVSAPSAVQGILAEVYGIPWRAEELERTPAKAAQLSRLCGEYPAIRLGLSREPPWDAEAAVLDQDGAELGLWSIGACHGYDAVPIALLNLDYLNGYGFGKSQRADELRPTSDPGRPERECSAMEAWP